MAIDESRLGERVARPSPLGFRRASTSCRVRVAVEANADPALRGCLLAIAEARSEDDAVAVLEHVVGHVRRELTPDP